MILDKKIEIFISVVKNGSFNQAARKLGLSPSVISFHIDSLEKHFGVTLFIRKGRSITPSKEGDILYNKTRHLTHEVALIEESFFKHSKKIKQKINLAGDALTCDYVLPKTLSGFHKVQPDVSFTYKHLKQEEMLSSVLAGDIDIALVGHYVPNKKLNAQKCFQDDIILVGLHGTDSPDTLTIEELKKSPVLWITSDRGLELALNSGLKKAGLSTSSLNIFMEVADLPIAKMLIREGVGIAFLPRLAVQDELKFNILKEIEIKGLEVERTTFLVYKKDKSQRNLITRFLEFLDENNLKLS